MIQSLSTLRLTLKHQTHHACPSRPCRPHPFGVVGRRGTATAGPQSWWWPNASGRPSGLLGFDGGRLDRLPPLAETAPPDVPAWPSVCDPCTRSAAPVSSQVSRQSTGYRFDQRAPGRIGTCGARFRNRVLASALLVLSPAGMMPVDVVGTPVIPRISRNSRRRLLKDAECGSLAPTDRLITPAASVMGLLVSSVAVE